MNTETNTITVTKADGTTKSVESPYLDIEAHAQLKKLVASGAAWGNFAKDLANKWFEKLSPKQMDWVHIIVVEAEAKLAAPKEEEAQVTFPGIREMFDGVDKKWPKVTLATENGEPVVIKRAGEMSRYPGRLHITDGGLYAFANQYYGFIDLDGGFTPRRSLEGLVETLTAFDADPVMTATKYGRETGSCCFCARELTTKESLHVGYGPVCADTFGLPWGATE